MHDPVLRAFHEAELFVDDVEREAHAARRARTERRQERALVGLVAITALFSVSVFSFGVGAQSEHRLALDAYASANYYRVLLAQTLEQTERAYEVCAVEHAHLSELLGYDVDPRWGDLTTTEADR